MADVLNSLMQSFLNSRLNSHWLFSRGGLALLPTTQNCDCYVIALLAVIDL